MIKLQTKLSSLLPCEPAIDCKKKTVRFAQDSDNERCASDTQLAKQTGIRIGNQKQKKQ